MQPAAASEIQPAISLLAKTPQLLETLLGDLPEELLQWKPAPGKWSAHEIIVHCADSETNAYMRLRFLLAEQDPVILGYDHSPVNNQYRNWMGQVDLLSRAAVHGCANALGIPARVVAQDPGRQIAGPLQPDTAMTEVPARLREELRRRGIVHVHVVAVGKDEFHQAECVLWTRLLPN